MLSADDFHVGPMVVKSQTFGEIEPELKHAMSHRAEAFRKLTNSLFR